MCNEGDDALRYEEVAKNFIIDDCNTLMKLIMCMPNSISSVFHLGSFSYMSLVIEGALKWCERKKIAVGNYDIQSTLEKLRAKAKLYSDDNKLTFQEQQSLLLQVAEDQRNYWLNLPWRFGPKVPAFLVDDIGIYTINGHHIGNTVEYAYELSPFIGNGWSFDVNRMMFEFSRSCGQAVASIAISLGNTIPNVNSVIEGVSNSNIRIKNIDYKMKKLPFLKGEFSFVIYNLICRLNFLIELYIPLCNSINELLAFRMAYVTYYHLSNDIMNLNLSDCYYNGSLNNKDFRNAMAHYSMFGKLFDSEIQEDIVGCGLFEKYFKSEFYEVRDKLYSFLYKTRDSLENKLCLTKWRW